MKKLVYLILALGITLISCDGRKTKHSALNESITKFKDTLKPLEVVEYIPKSYSEIKTDTILSNGFSIHIKNYTNMDKSVVHKYKVGTTTHIDIYRNWISEIKINMNGKLILNEIIDNTFFKKNNIQSTDAINIGAKFDNEYSIEKDDINLFIGFKYPYSENTIIYNMKIDKKGNYRLKKELELWETI